MLNYLKHLILIAVELWINLSVCMLYQSHIVRLTPVVYLIWQPFWIYDNLNMSLTSTNEVLGLYNPCVHAKGIDPCQKTIELRSFSCYRSHFGSHIEKPYDLVIKCNFCQHQCTPWPLKARTRWKNLFPRPKIKWDIDNFLDLVAMLAAILDFSNSSRVTECHPMDYWSRPLSESESTGNNYAPNFAHFSPKKAFGTQTVGFIGENMTYQQSVERVGCWL